MIKARSLFIKYPFLLRSLLCYIFNMTQDTSMQEFVASYSAIMDSIKNTIEADKSLHVGLFHQFRETTHKDNKCYRTFRAVVEIRLFVPVDS